MSSYKFRLVFVALLIMFVFGISGSSCAMEEAVDWFDHEFGSVSVTVRKFAGEEETLLMDGLLRFAYPEGFQLEYHTRTAPVRITSQAGFVQVQVGIDVQYGYDRYWLFEDVQTYIFALAEFSRIALRPSGPDQVAERASLRYVANDDSQLMLWFDEESNVPLLVRHDQRTLLTVTSYILENHQITSIGLELCFGPEQADITLERGPYGWNPKQLVIHDPQGRVQMDFANWTFAEQWEDNPLPRLTELSELNIRFFEEFNAGNYEQALNISQEMLALAPRFWQVYLYQAFAYEGIDNYLGVVENYQQVLMRQPDNHLALNNLAYHYFLREVQIPQALEMAERAVELERKDIYLDTLGYGYYLVGRYEEAKELLLEALETAPDDAVDEITEHLNLVLEALGD